MGAIMVTAKISNNYEQLGIDTMAPRFSWVITDSNRDEIQTAYQIIVASTEVNLDNHVGDQWDSGKITSRIQHDVLYEGSLLESAKKYWWKVRTWGRANNAGSWSMNYSFVTGFMEIEHWTAKWIQDSDSSNSYASPLFRKLFNSTKAVKHAFAYICGLGQFTLYLNGDKVGDHELDPGWTNYDKSCLYVTFDVTKEIKLGANTLGVILGNGFYNVHDSQGRYSKLNTDFGPNQLICELHIEFTDNSVLKIVSDESWKSAKSPISYSHIYGGEDYDARKELPGWNSVEFNDSEWDQVVVAAPVNGRLTSQKQPPLKIMRTYSVVNIMEPQPELYVYDLGINFSGFFEIVVQGKAGQSLRILPSENLKPDGTVDQESIGAIQYCSYTLKGEVVETWRPMFYYSGFRYLQIEGASWINADLKPTIINVKGLNMYSAAKQTGQFSSSNESYNGIHQMLMQSFKSNLQSVLTDCPHREKLGWLECSQLLADSFAYNFEIHALWSKIAQDMSEAQTADGLVPDIAPEYTVFEAGFRQSTGWGSAAILAPWHIYWIYGDITILQRQYDTMSKYLSYLLSIAKDNIIEIGLGDWGGIQAWNTELVETTQYYHDIVIMSQIAELLGYTEESTEYSKLALQVKTSFNEQFFNWETSCYSPITQAHEAMPLALGLVPAGYEQKVLKTLLDDISANGNHVQTGEIGHRYMLQALSDHGYHQVIDQIIMNPTAPSFNYLLSLGKTSMPEYWDGSCSQQHAMMGHVEAWFYNTIAGIKPLKPGYEEISIKPTVISSHTSASASIETIRGLVCSSWTKTASQFLLDVTIPVNSKGIVYLPIFHFNNFSLKEGRKLIEPDSKKIECSTGVTWNRIEDNHLILNVGSGNYNFILSQTEI
ncbi:alpha-L-rhamnosidase [Paenibacillus psychroresistens]|uniref:alpha-L-rhamnosidase n=1 Tax=Paenibacillus psychroresistens TaxID=1778678 RepID=A0A6B8RIC5_9BACL|nr:family 78 glycoside hydrolase catalytic domain [Paenibacillus psychroresistens]QGQ95136.1 alpha-L-rhamnosidase [Paenibacillus psychroresistens]